MRLRDSRGQGYHGTHVFLDKIKKAEGSVFNLIKKEDENRQKKGKKY